MTKDGCISCTKFFDCDKVEDFDGNVCDDYNEGGTPLTEKDYEDFARLHNG